MRGGGEGAHFMNLAGIIKPDAHSTYILVGYLSRTAALKQC